MKNYLHLFAIFATSASLTAGTPPITAAPLPIHVANAPGGILTNNHLTSRANRLFVNGRFEQALGQDIPAAAHVDVDLLATDGSLVATRRDDIHSSHPRLSRGRTGRIPFVVSFPSTSATTASLVRITYHPAPHS